MKNILVGGADSYVGTSFMQFMAKWPDDYNVECVDVRNDQWKQQSFSKYDSIFFLAGIAHIKEIEENKPLYYQVNRDLPIEFAKKAKEDGVKHFVFISSMSVYGLETGVIDKNTVPAPKTNYGISKLQAEEGLNQLVDDNFQICVIRPPMIYGKGCRGNFNSVVSLVKKLPAFPRLKNQRSLIYIDNLCGFVKKAIDENMKGVYFPQNREYMNTTQMASWIAESLNKKVYMSYLLGFGVKVLQLFLSVARKGFGSLIYKDTEDFDYDYCVVDLEESVKRSV